MSTVTLPPFADKLAKKFPILNYLLEPIVSKYMDFNGRATVKEFWMYALLLTCVFASLFIVSTILSIVFGMIGLGFIGMIFMLIILLLYLGVLAPSLAIGIRRMHDIGQAGWMILIPLYGLYLAIQPSQAGENQYGAPVAPASEPTQGE